MPESTTADHANYTVDELKTLLREAEAALASAGNEAGEGIESLRERLRNAFAEGKNTLGHAAEYARKQAARADELVRANPYTTVGLATGLGLLTGYLIARSCSSRNC